MPDEAGQTKITGREPRLQVVSEESGKRRLSLRRLGTMLNALSPDKVSLDAIAEMIKSDDTLVRYNAAKLLGKRADRSARTVVEDALKNGQPRTRASVARHLYGFSWYTAKPLLEMAFKDSDPRVRESAVYSLCVQRDGDAYDMLLEKLDGEDDLVLEAAAVGLREAQEPQIVDVMKKVMHAVDPDVRVKGLEALGMSGLKQAMLTVREAMFDPEPHVKYAATLSLLELAGEGWLQELAGVIGRTSGETLEQVLLGFFHATNYLKIDVARSESADLMLDALENALYDEHVGVRKAAIWPLAWLRHERSPKILLRTYRIEMDPDVKAHIVRVAAGLMSEASEEILQDALQQSDETVRDQAERIMRERKAAGFVLKYEDGAYEGLAMDRSLLAGRYNTKGKS